MQSYPLNVSTEFGPLIKHRPARPIVPANLTTCVVAIAALVAWMTVSNSGASAVETAGQNTGEAAKQATTNGGEYRLAPGDRLAVAVFGNADLSGDFAIDGSGQILLPLVGSVTVGDLTAIEAQQLIQSRLADGILVKPASAFA